MSNKPVVISPRPNVVSAELIEIKPPVHKKRELDILTALLCLVVIYIHVAGEAVFSYDRTTLSYAAVSIPFSAALFAVPAFILLASVKFTISSQNKTFHYGKFMLGRLKLIYLPYLLWNVIYYSYFLSRRWFPFDINGLARHIWIGDLSGQFYFIVVIMQFYLLAPVWRKFAALRVNYAVIAAFITIIPAIYFNNYSNIPYTDRIFITYLPYWLMGIVIGAHYDKFILFLRRRKAALIASTILIAAFHQIYSYLHSRQILFYSYSEQMHVLYNFLMIFSIIFICVYINKPKIYAVCKPLAAASYYIFLSHCLVLTDVRIRMSDAGIYSVTTRFWVSAAATYIIPVVLSIAYVKLKPLIKGIIQKPST